MIKLFFLEINCSLNLVVDRKKKYSLIGFTLFERLKLNNIEYIWTIILEKNIKDDGGDLFLLLCSCSTPTILININFESIIFHAFNKLSKHI